MEEANINADNRASSTLIELPPESSHLSSSSTTSTTNEQLAVCPQTGLRLVELGMNLYGIGNAPNPLCGGLTKSLTNASLLNASLLNASSLAGSLNARQQIASHPAALLSEHQLITMGTVQQQQNQLDAAAVYQLAAGQALSEKQSGLQSGLMQTIENDNLILSNLNSLSPIDTTPTTLTTIDQLSSLNGFGDLSHLNNLNGNIELINSSFGQFVFNIDSGGQLSPYLDLNDLKDGQSKQSQLINTLLAEKYPITSDSLLVQSGQSLAGQMNGDQLGNQMANQLGNQMSNQLGGQVANVQLNNQLSSALNGQLTGQTAYQLSQLTSQAAKQYAPSPFVQFQLLNDSLPDHQSIIISSVSSNSTRTTTLPSSSQPSTTAAHGQPSGNPNSQQFASEQSNDLINDYHLAGAVAINHRNEPLKSAAPVRTSYSVSTRLIKTIKRDHYRDSIELSACLWYTIAIACHQKVPFKRRFVL